MIGKRMIIIGLSLLQQEIDNNAWRTMLKGRRSTKVSSSPTLVIIILLNQQSIRQCTYPHQYPWYHLQSQATLDESLIYCCSHLGQDIDNISILVLQTDLGCFDTIGCVKPCIYIQSTSSQPMPYGSQPKIWVMMVYGIRRGYKKNFWLNF